MTTNPISNPKTQALAVALHAKLSTVDITSIPVMSRERHLPRKEQAALARSLFKRLGLVGISVTTPSYSMAQSVDVAPPKREDYDMDDLGFMVCGCAAAMANSEARSRLESILLAAFPRHDDRSDTQTDYFDYCWSIS